MVVEKLFPGIVDDNFRGAFLLQAPFQKRSTPPEPQPQVQTSGNLNPTTTNRCAS